MYEHVVLFVFQPLQVSLSLAFITFHCRLGGLLCQEDLCWRRPELRSLHCQCKSMEVFLEIPCWTCVCFVFFKQVKSFLSFIWNFLLALQTPQNVDDVKIQDAHRKIWTLNENMINKWLNHSSGRLPQEISK